MAFTGLEQIGDLMATQDLRSVACWLDYDRDYTTLPFFITVNKYYAYMLRSITDRFGDGVNSSYFSINHISRSQFDELMGGEKRVNSYAWYRAVWANWAELSKPWQISLFPIIFNLDILQVDFNSFSGFREDPCWVTMRDGKVVQLSPIFHYIVNADPDQSVPNDIGERLIRIIRDDSEKPWACTRRLCNWPENVIYLTHDEVRRQILFLETMIRFYIAHAHRTTGGHITTIVVAPAPPQSQQCMWESSQLGVVSGTVPGTVFEEGDAAEGKSTDPIVLKLQSRGMESPFGMAPQQQFMGEAMPGLSLSPSIGLSDVTLGLNTPGSPPRTPTRQSVAPQTPPRASGNRYPRLPDSPLSPYPPLPLSPPSSPARSWV